MIIEWTGEIEKYYGISSICVIDEREPSVGPSIRYDLLQRFVRSNRSDRELLKDKVASEVVTDRQYNMTRFIRTKDEKRENLEKGRKSEG